MGNFVGFPYDAIQEPVGHNRQDGRSLLRSNLGGGVLADECMLQTRVYVTMGAFIPLGLREYIGAA